MKKDGTFYLVKLSLNGNDRWEIVRWGMAAMHHDLQGWCHSNGIAQKGEITEWISLNDAIEILTPAFQKIKLK